MVTKKREIQLHAHFIVIRKPFFFIGNKSTQPKLVFSVVDCNPHVDVVVGDLMI